MTSRAPGATEPYKPVWASLVEEFRLRRELLDEVAAKGEWTGEQHCRATLAMAEMQIESLASVLWRAEAELLEARRVLNELTRPKGKGHRRRPEQADAQIVADRANFLQHCAELDGDDMTRLQAVKAALVEMGRLRPDDEPGESELRADRRARRANRGS